MWDRRHCPPNLVVDEPLGAQNRVVIVMVPDHASRALGTAGLRWWERTPDKRKQTCGA